MRLNTGGIDMFIVKLAFQMSTVRAQQHSFSANKQKNIPTFDEARPWLIVCTQQRNMDAII